MNIKKYAFVLAAGLFLVGSVQNVSAEPIINADFESGNFTGWDKGTQSGSLNSTINGSGTGVSIINSAVTFNAPAGSEVGTPGSQYFQPAIPAATWVFSPYGQYAAALQPNSQYTFDQATNEIGLLSADNNAIKQIMATQASASGWGSGTPTDASWLRKTVTLNSGVVYTMSWNYIGTDYVPFNDGSITSLTPVDQSSTASITVNNQNQRYALLGFTNPGTGDYSTGTYGSTGWQISTYEVSESGEYILGFAVFNLDDTALSPVLLVDSEPGGTTKDGEDFGAVAPNNPDAPTVPPSTDAPVETDPPATDIPVDTDAPVTDAPVDTEAPVDTDPPVETDPPATDPVSTDAPVETDPPATDAPEQTTTTEAEEVVVTRPEITSTSSTSSTLIVTTTISIPDTTIADANIPSDSVPISELPKTGSGINIAIVGAFLIFFGLILSHIRKWLAS